MDYGDFIEFVGRHQTERVKGLHFDSCCATNGIPSSVLSFIPQLIRLLHNSHIFLSEPDQIIYLFGLQPCVIALQPSLSEIADEKNSESHLCYVIKYLLLDRHQKQPSTWSKEHNLVINFTTGQLMDNQYYLSMVFNLDTQGTVYGKIYDQEANDTLFNKVTPQSLSMAS